MWLKNYFSSVSWAACAVIVIGSHAHAQETQSDALARILDRLNALEQQNQAVLAEIRELREQLKAAQPETSAQNQKLEDRVNVNEQRIKEQEQKKVESSQRFPITLTGMLLFDSFYDTGQPSYRPAVGGYSYAETENTAGATLRQSIIGFDFRGPSLPGGGQVNGFLSMDFYAQAMSNDVFRIRRGVISFNWKRRSITVGQDKSIIAPLQPTSFARVGIPPLDGAGNLWLWRPQIRYEERIPVTAGTQLALQLGVVQTDETYSVPTLPAYASIDQSRPAIQGRFEVRHQWSEQTRVAAGVGFHSSSSHVLGQSIPSQVVSADLIFKPFQKLELSGTVFHGKNFSNIGGGPPGFSVTSQYVVIPIRGNGGWVQVALPVTSRLTFDFYAGRQLNDARDLTSYEVARTLTYAGNVLYRISPNILLGLEASQQRLDVLDLHQLLTNRYDATVAYLF